MSSQKQQRPIVFFDINIGETPAGRIKMELFNDVVPKWVAPSSQQSSKNDGADTPLTGQQRTSDNYVQENSGLYYCCIDAYHVSV
jgi:hypothetical protein